MNDMSSHPPIHTPAESSERQSQALSKAKDIRKKSMELRLNAKTILTEASDLLKNFKEKYQEFQSSISPKDH